jgi:ABC-type amino acid transport substrate-binding protein
MLKKFLLVLFLILSNIASSTMILAQSTPTPNNDTPPAKKLIVGTKEVAPFVIKNPDGSLSGISIDLWREMATEMNISYEFKEYDLDGLINGVSDGSIDVGIAAISITPAREEKFDFTQPYYNTGLGIAVPVTDSSTSGSLFNAIFSTDLIKAILGLIVVLFAMGFLMWLAEHRKNPDQFGGGIINGLGSGFWWSAVTMTTVGYGDKFPTTVIGRLIGLFWMFAAIIMISSFTATIASSLTVNKLQSSISGPEDLVRVKVGVVENSTSENYMKKNNINYRGYKTAQEGLEALAEKKIGAMVYDMPTLQYLVNTKFKDNLEVLPNAFERQNYGIGLPLNSPLRKPINRVLLQKIGQPNWQSILYRYLGEDGVTNSSK